MNTGDRGRALAWLTAGYTAASLLHFVHNATYLGDYPNLPAWITTPGVYITWLCIAAVGLMGYVLFRRGRGASGLAILALYAAFGFDGLLHYTRAPLSAHTLAMNLTIMLEALSASALLIAVINLAVRRALGWKMRDETNVGSALWR